jgi:glycosyltransferase-like protein
VHTLSLAEALASLGQDVTVWALARGGDSGFFRPVDPSVTVRAVPFPEIPGETVGERVLRSIAALRNACDTTGADVVHAEDCISANALPGCVRTVHHVDTFTTPDLAACHERAIVDPRAHICVSAAVAAELRAGWGIEATVVPNGVDAERFAAAASPAAPAAARRRAWRDRLAGDPLVLVVGGIEPRKGTLDLLDALAALRRDRPQARLAVAGGETLFDYRDYRAAFDARRAELGVDVDVLGPIDHEALPSLVATADVFAFPSTKEGFGIAPMEALAAGVPVVARDLPVMREVFGESVRYAHDGASFATALACPPDSTRSELGRRLAARHTWEAAATAHLAFYERLVG